MEAISARLAEAGAWPPVPVRLWLEDTLEPLRRLSRTLYWPHCPPPRPDTEFSEFRSFDFLKDFRLNSLSMSPVV